MILMSCSRNDKATMTHVPWPVPQNHPARQFFMRANSAPVAETLCTEMGGTEIVFDRVNLTGKQGERPFQRIAGVENSVWLSRERSTGDIYIQVSFSIDKGAGLFAISTCGWKTAD